MKAAATWATMSGALSSGMKYTAAGATAYRAKAAANSTLGVLLRAGAGR